ncbi:hypothetical protein Ait01nite_000610 [Actinoplanes italicus]|nr:hypothetical protein Ait01nite_000610 [Actinoplanes italicus]
MRQVDEHADPVHLSDHLAAEVVEPAEPGCVGGAVGPRDVLLVGQGQIPDAQLTEHPQDRQGVADAVAALGTEQPGDPSRPERGLHAVSRRHELEPAGVAAVQRVHQVDLLQGPDHGSRRRQVAGHVDRPELGAHPPGGQSRQVGTGQWLMPVERELVQVRRGERAAVQGAQRVR